MAKNGDLTHFLVHDSAFYDILGANPRLERLAEDPEVPFAHEAGVFIAARNELFITSNRLTDARGQPTIRITKVILSSERGSTPLPSARCEEIHCDAIKMGNGGVNYAKDDSSILICDQGSLSSPSGLYEMYTSPPYATRLILSDFYGRPFNSVNDVVVAERDGAIWFTDPIYGYEQGYRPKPRLPNQVYRFDPRTGSIRAVADGFGRPNGLCFSPDEKIMYITDTDWIHGDGTTHDMRSSTIYAFDVCTYSGQPFLTNRRLFAFADTGVPDGIKCDMAGNVYSGCGDGVNVWSLGGVLLGRILVGGEGAANFCFGRRGEMFIMNETILWRARLAETVRGALLKI